MKNNYLIKLLVFTIIINVNLSAQTKFKSGFIITLERDTINGFVLENIDSELVFKIDFKKDIINSQINTYMASDLLGFGFKNGRTFERMPYKKIGEIENDFSYVFAKNKIKGKIDLLLWRHTKKAKPDMFLRNNKNGKIALLTIPKKRIITETDGRTYSVENLTYMGLLNYIKHDSTNLNSNKSIIKYSEKSIGEDILEYNKIFQKDYPIQKYTEKIKYSYNFILGLPFDQPSRGVLYRIALYRDKTNIEESNVISFIRGITFRNWSNNNKKVDNSFENGTANYKWQLLNIIPFGIKYQGKSKIIKPYGYIGGGLAILMLTDYKIVNYVNTGSQTRVIPFPTLNLGVGLKIKAGPIFILTEITPTLNDGIFMNIGLSF